MELINNRYRIIKNLKQNRLYASYLVSDITEEYKEVQLNLFNSDFLPDSLSDTYANNFLDYTKLATDRIVRDYRFGTVSYVDNKKSHENQYYFTHEYMESTETIYELTANMDLSGILDVFVDLCKAINYIHLRGYVYGHLNTGSILVVRKKGVYKLKLKDLANLELERYVSGHDMVDEAYFKAPKLLAGETEGRQTDIYALGVLLLDLLRRNERDTISVRTEFEQLRDKAMKGTLDSYGIEETQNILKLLPILEKLLTSSNQYPYNYVLDFMDEVNGVLGRTDEIFKLEEIERLTFHNKIIDRHEEVLNILKSYDYMAKYKPVKRIFLIHGNTGCGKTRLLKEIEFQLSLKRANIFSSYSLSILKDSSNQLWIEILRKLISESDPEIIEKYESELMKFFPEITDRKNQLPVEYLSRDKAKYRLINRIVGFIGENVKNKPTIAIIDNVHRANEFTLETMRYLASEVTNIGNLIIVFSYNDAEIHGNPKFLEFISTLRERKDSEIINIRDLDFGQAGELVRSILSMPYTPIKLVEKIYSQSYGNPMFINEIIKHLYSRRAIYVHGHTGKWVSDYSSGSGYKDLPIPNSIEQAVLNQLRDSDELAHEVLKVASLFTNAISIRNFTSFIREAEEKLEIVVQELVDKGLLCKKIGDTSYVYEINNRVLKDIVYERLSIEEKIQKHAIAASVLESSSEAVKSNNIDELIMHYERAGVRDKVKQYCLEHAKHMEHLKERGEQIKSLEKAITMIDSRDKAEIIGLLLEVGNLYLDGSDFVKAIEYFEKAEDIAKKAKDYMLLFDCVKYKIPIYNNQNNMQKIKRNVTRLRELLKQFDSKERWLEYRMFEAFLELNTGDTNLCVPMYESIIADCGEDCPRIKGEANRYLAYTYSLHNRVEDAISTYQQSIALMEPIGKMKSVLLAYNNIGAIYMDFYQDLDLGLEYINKVKELSEEYNYPNTELLAITNIASIYDSKFEHKLAYDSYKQALEMAITAGSENDMFYLYNSLNAVSLKLGFYNEAHDFFNLSRKELEKHPNQGKDIIMHYKSNALFYFAYGEFKEADKEIKKALQSIGRGESIDRLDCEVTRYMIDIRTKSVSTYTGSIEKLIPLCEQFVMYENRALYLSIAAEMLVERGDFVNALKLVHEAEKTLIGPIPDEVHAKYLLAAGRATSREGDLKSLLFALEVAKKISNKELVYKITVAIGDHYLENGNANFAANYYIEAYDVSKKIVSQIPDEHRLKFVNGHGMAKAYNRARYLYELMTGTDDSVKEKASLLHEKGLASTEEVDRMFYDDLIVNFASNDEFIASIRALYMSYLPDGIRDEVDILANLQNDTKKNIELILRYLATLTFASNAYVVVDEKNREQRVITAMNNTSQGMQFNKPLIDRVKATGEPILISDSNVGDGESDYLAEGLKACICIPIRNTNVLEVVQESGNKRHTTSKTVNFGYLYLESDKILNNFNHNGLNSCDEFSGLLAILLEKHQLKRSASVDKLTGALTRKYLEDALEDTLERTSSCNSVFSIIIYDLDKFKSVNDRFGHQTGDDVLRKVSKTVLESLGRNDILGRYGGEEFIIVLPGTGLEDASLVAEELRKKIQNGRILGDKADVTISMGIASYPLHGQFVQELVEKADQALYVAKENGRNKCQAWDSGFASMIKGTNKLNGIISGNAVQDSRNVLAMVELIQLGNSTIKRKEKIYSFLGRVIEITEAQLGALFIIKNDEIVQQFARKSMEEEWQDKFEFNRNTVASVIKNKQGVYMIDWDYVGNHDVLTGIPDWYSIMVVPVMAKDQLRAVIYLSVSTKIKEYSINDYNFINVLSDLAATII